jgi:epoxyqueuosine reductase
MEKNRSRKTFHPSTISRRDFMKMLGLGSVGVGATALGLPSGMPIKSLDDLMGADFASRKLPFWVKEVDKPTVDIDWEQVTNYPGMTQTLFFPGSVGISVEDWEKRHGNHLMKTAEMIKSGELLLQDWVLNDAGWYHNNNNTIPWSGTDGKTNPTSAYFMSPEEMGVPRYEGSPEEASRMIRAVARLFGAFDVGFVNLDENTKKLLFGNIRFEKVEEGYNPGDGTLVLPDKDLWVIVSAIPQSLFMAKNKWGSDHAFAYGLTGIFEAKMQTFLHGIGYQSYGGNSANVGLAVPFGVLAGIGEYARTTQMVSPYVGNMFRTVMLTVTDLPVAETKPIDAGILRFCKTCKKCAKNCPAGALSLEDDPVWIDTSLRPAYHGSAGVKGYYSDAMKCITQMFSGGHHCNVCQYVCPFNKFDKASLHEIIKGVISATPIANELIASLDNTFGYGVKEDGLSIWEKDPWDIPLLGLDTSRS